MQISRSLLLAAALGASAALASTAQAAEISRPGSLCGPDPGYEPFVAKDDLTIFTVQQFAYINCFGRDPSRNINVSRIRVRVFDSQDGDSVICVVKGLRNQGGSTITTFGPLVLGSGATLTGNTDMVVNVPASNNTQVVSFNCYLPAPTGIGPSRLRNYTLTTR